MTYKDLDYDGRPQLRRHRNLVEVPVDDNLSPGIAPDTSDPIDKNTNRLFTDLGKSYLKGEVLRKGLKAMLPAQIIPISEAARDVRVSAKRFSADLSVKGTVVPYEMFTEIVDLLGEAQWKVRRIYETIDLPPDSYSRSKEYTKHYEHGGQDFENMFKSFFDGSGEMGSLMMAFCVAPFQNVGFQALTIESATKVVMSIQNIIGIVLLIELGYSVIEIVKAISSTVDIEPQLAADIQTLSEDPEARRQALAEASVDYDEFLESTRIPDAHVILDYCKEYMESHSPDSPVTYDHWIAYLNVVPRQNLIRGALDNATIYSKDFSNTFNRDLPRDSVTGDVVKDVTQGSPQSRISNVTASHYANITASSNRMYEDILNSFMYQVSDDQMCCMVEAFGAVNPGILKSLSKVLKMMSVDMQDRLAVIAQGGVSLLSNIAVPAVDRIISKMDRMLDKVMLKVLEGLEDVQDEFPDIFQQCLALNDITAAVGITMINLKDQVEGMLRDITSYMQMQGNLDIGWTIAADRRHTLSMASILDSMASAINAARACEGRDDRTDIAIDQAKDQAANEIIHTLIKNSPPSIQISDDDIRKYYPDLQPSVSSRFKISFGPATIFKDRVGRVEPDGTIRRDDTQNNCSSSELTHEVSEKIAHIVSNAFSRNNG